MISPGRLSVQRAVFKCIYLFVLFQKNMFYNLSIDSFKFLTVLNLNGNQLRSLPPEIGRLERLEVLSVAENQLGAPDGSFPPGSGIPVDFCALSRVSLILYRTYVYKIFSIPDSRSN